MKALKVAVLIVLTVSLAGCAGLSSTQQRVLSGGAIGTAAGVGAAAIAGAPLIAGAACGAAAGVVGGYIVDEVIH